MRQTDPRPAKGEGRARRRALRAIAAAVVAFCAANAAPAARVLAEEPERADAAARRWRVSSLTVGVADDFFAPPISGLRDDDGFTAGLRLSAELSDDERRTVRIDLSQQMLTERRGLARADDGRITARWERLTASSGGNRSAIGWTVGLAVVGNLGGSRIQDWAHRVVFSGRLLSGHGSQRLQYQYAPGYDALALAGVHATLVHPLYGPLSLRGGVEALVGVGTGFLGELHPHVGAGVATRHVDFEVRLGAGSYATTVRSLELRGGYVTGVLQLQPAARITVVGPRRLGTLFMSMSWELNRGNSSQQVGELAIGKRF